VHAINARPGHWLLGIDPIVAKQVLKRVWPLSLIVIFTFDHFQNNLSKFISGMLLITDVGGV
jgi:hypothetical protein